MVGCIIHHALAVGHFFFFFGGGGGGETTAKVNVFLWQLCLCSPQTFLKTDLKVTHLSGCATKKLCHILVTEEHKKHY